MDPVPTKNHSIGSRDSSSETKDSQTTPPLSPKHKQPFFAKDSLVSGLSNTRSTRKMHYREPDDNLDDELLYVTGKFAHVSIDKSTEKPSGNAKGFSNKLQVDTKTQVDSSPEPVPISYSHDSASYSNYSRSFSSITSTVISEQANFSNEVSDGSKLKEIRRVRFIRPQTIIEYDSEEGTACESAIPDTSEEKGTIFSKFLGSGWSAKKQVEQSENVKLNKKIISIYKKSCNDFEETPNPSVLEALKNASKLDQPFTVLKLAGLKNLTKNTNAFADLMEISKDLKTLEIVDCQLKNNFTKTISISLVRLQKLETINISENPDIQMDGFKHLFLAASELKSLKTLNISGIQITLESAKWIAEGLNLIALKDTAYEIDRSINLYMDNCSFSLQSLETTLNAVKKSKVRRLFLRKNKLNKHHVLSLKRLLVDTKRKSILESLRNNDRSGSILSDLSAAVPNSQENNENENENENETENNTCSYNLKMIDLSNNPLGDVVAEISKMFAYMKEIRSLVLRKCNISYTSFAALSKGIQDNKCIATLDISRNTLFSKFNEKEVRSMSDLLDNATTLETLTMEDCGINEGIALIIAGHLETAPSIRSISLLGNNCVTKRTLQAFIIAARKNPRIGSIKLTVHIGNEEQRNLEKNLASICAKNVGPN